jgi:hypothetical protein
MHVQALVTLPLPVERAFALMSDLDRWLPEVDDSVLSLTRVTDGALGVGTVWIERVKAPARPMEFRVEVTEYKPPRKLGISTIGPILKGTGVTSFESVGDEATTVRFELDISPRRLGWVLLPMLRSRLRAVEQARLDEVRRLVDCGDMIPPSR